MNHPEGVGPGFHQTGSALGPARFVSDVGYLPNGTFHSAGHQMDQLRTLEAEDFDFIDSCPRGSPTIGHGAFLGHHHLQEDSSSQLKRLRAPAAAAAAAACSSSLFALCSS